MELTRWLGAAAVKRDLTSKMREAKEARGAACFPHSPPLTRSHKVEESLDAVAGTPPAPSRYLHKDAAKAVAASVAAESAPGGGATAAAPARGGQPAGDVYDLMEPEDVLSKLAKRKPTFGKGVASANWKDRLAAFNDVASLASAPRLAAGDYGEITRAVRSTVLNDANSAVVAAAIDAAAALAVALRRDYRADARSLTGPLLDKLKDKALNVLRSLHAALPLFARHCYALTDVLEEAAAAMEHKVPKVQVEACAWTAAAFAALDPPGAAKAAAALAPLLRRLGSEAPSPAVRDAALLTLAAVGAGAGGAGVAGGGAPPAAQGLDPLRAKRMEQLTAKPQPASKGGAAAKASAPAHAAAPARAAAPSAPRPPAAAPPRPGSKPAAAPPRASSTASVSRPGSGGGAPAGVRRAATAPAVPGASLSGADEDTSDYTDVGFRTEEDVASSLESLLAPAGFAAICKRLGDSDWEARAAAVGSLKCALVALPVLKLDISAVEVAFRQLCFKPGWADSNAKVVAAQLLCAAAVTRAACAFTRREAGMVLDAATDRAIAAPTKAAALELLDAIAARVSPRFVALQLHRRAASHRSPKAMELAYEWMAASLTAHGATAVDAPRLASLAKAGLGSPTPAVKTAAVKLLGAVHASIGPAALRPLLAGLSPPLLKTLDAVFAKCPHIANT